jgi:hypothetical protein
VVDEGVALRDAVVVEEGVALRRRRSWLTKARS